MTDFAITLEAITSKSNEDNPLGLQSPFRRHFTPRTNDEFHPSTSDEYGFSPPFVRETSKRLSFPSDYSKPFSPPIAKGFLYLCPAPVLQQGYSARQPVPDFRLIKRVPTSSMPLLWVMIKPDEITAHLHSTSPASSPPLLLPDFLSPCALCFLILTSRETLFRCSGIPRLPEFHLEVAIKLNSERNDSWYEIVFCLPL
ncbi:Hypothetical protein NTJ_09833 [Nesidiocoris tenuis]|uniref:RHD domain-containing protein n=1 Tax=Nesidiocoris tenuis TaxID=355587 RepID=A0ABN7B1D9_9HEMI|nr:Hypothetical protein NTJ_09833 [Nesidiocoris tenuis]